MSKLTSGSIDLTALGEMARANHPAITTGNNGRKYIQVSVWINENVNEYGAIGSIQVYDKNTQEKKYIGNLKQPYNPSQNTGQPLQNLQPKVNQTSPAIGEVPDLPF